jgi:prepilin-type N-terminal cleavage/methylation domain-containing protein
MKSRRSSQSGLTLVELSVTIGLVGVLGLIIYTLLNMGTILGAKNTAMNTAHQQARVAMLEMFQHLHSSVSLPQLVSVNGTQAAGVSFQQWGSALSNGVLVPNGGPHKIKNDAATNQKVIHIVVTSNQPNPIVGQRLIVPTHQIEDRIASVSGSSGDLSVTLDNNLPVAISGTSSSVGDIVCYITDRCSYNVILDNAGPPAVYKLQWANTQGTRDIVNDITNPLPFSIPTTPAGALYYRFVAAVNLSTSDPNYSKRGYKSANILLNGQVPFRAKLTTYQ